MLTESGWFSLDVRLLFGIFHCSSSVLISLSLNGISFLACFQSFGNLILFICSSLFWSWDWSIAYVLISRPESIILFSLCPESIGRYFFLGFNLSLISCSIVISFSFMSSSSLFLGCNSCFSGFSLHVENFSFWLLSQFSSGCSHGVLVFFH